MSSIPLTELHGTNRAVSASAQISPDGMLPVLIATRTASLLELDVLAFLSSKYRVQLFAEPFNLFDIRASQVKVALLCATAGSSRLAAEAFIIRKQWPLARIIVLGRPPDALADHLYDDSVAQNSSSSRLASVFSARAIDVWQNRGSFVSGKGELSQSPAESDPTKADPTDLLPLAPPTPRDLPADERRTLLGASGRSPNLASQA